MNILTTLRQDIIEMAQHSAHVASALSCVDILAALYFEVLRVSPATAYTPDRDRFILSKGHGCMALYAVLAEAGFIAHAELGTYAQNGSVLAEHPLADKIPGIEFASGTLGHGLAVAVGMAKALKLQKTPARVFVLLGDGECDEGSIWEGAAIAVAHRLDNVSVLIDWNRLQACGSCQAISAGISLPDCWQGFGWDVAHVDGHDVPMMVEAFKRPNAVGQPRVIFCRTIKGKGIDFMEGNLEWHYRPVLGAERAAALQRLEHA